MSEMLMLMPDLSAGFIIRVIVEILLLWYVIYKLLYLIKSTRAWLLLKGIILISSCIFIIYILRLDTVLYLLNKAAAISIMCLVVVFQPELRRALEHIGSTELVKYIKQQRKEDASKNRETIEQIADASFKMGSKLTGALMVIKKNQDLTDINNTGILVDGVVSSGLLINIFEKNTPLHDGALTIEGNRAAYATCYLPLSENMSISKDLGTRHRAALGVSEVTDTVTVVVSEETGNVTVACNGGLKRMNSKEELVKYLLDNL
jgi:diadenylate cyclase